jgi:hypothetical protein
MDFRVLLRSVIVIMSFASMEVVAASRALPKYDVTIKLDTPNHRAEFTETVTWTNTSSKPTSEIVFNFYPQYRIPEGDYLLLAKTLELLRLNPSYGVDRVGRAGRIARVHQNGVLLEYHFRHDNGTAVVVDLPKPVQPGEAVTVSIDAVVQLPNKQGRWGYWQGVTSLVNALPVVAFHDDDGFHAMPFVPWHQPFFHEAGHYTATITLPTAEKLACSAVIKSSAVNADGTTTHVTEPFTGRDFAVIASARFEEFSNTITTPRGKRVEIKCLAFKEHEFYAREILRIGSEAIPYYSEWFAEFPYSQLTYVESYFGWNGNECSGLIMIDERVFASPRIATGYVEYLASHETCHQWWYNLVGNNGYRETYIDEGAATYFTHKMLDKKLGKNNPFMAYPKGLEWLPNIRRENYRNASMYSAIGKNEFPAAAGELPGFGHLIGLFNGAYDRGAKAYGLIEAKLGEERFAQFLKQLFARYSWRVLQEKDLKAELEAFTGQPWDAFFESHIYSKEVGDWSIGSVERSSKTHAMIGSVAAKNLITVRVAHSGEAREPTMLAVSLAEGDGYPIRVPVGGPTPPADGRGAPIITEDGPGQYSVTLELPSAPVQISIDPDRVLIDRNPANNHWKNPPKVTVSPFYSLLNETDLTADYDRWNFGGGPWIGGTLAPDPWYVRSTMLGVRAGAYRTQIFSGGVYGAYRTDFRDLVVGADGVLDHWPLPKSQVGFNVERRIDGPYGNVEGADTATRASGYARYIFQYGSSLYLPPIHYAELYHTYQDNFLPVARHGNAGAIRPDWTYLAGIHHRVNLYTPYWDPECGIWTDFVYGAGVAELAVRETMHQMRGEIAFVKPLFSQADCLGPLADTRVAMRAVAMGAFPDAGQFFALGGGTLFRGFDLAERQGSFLWVANAELRFPLIREVQWNLPGDTVGARNIWLAAFYDVGAVYGNGRRVQSVAHALGVGLRVDTAIFSFIERATFRFDVAKTLDAPSPYQFWFGIQHAY